MKTKHILFGIFISSAVTSCNSIKGSGNVVTSIRPVQEFSGIISSGSFNMYLTQSAVQEVKIIADDNVLQYIETNVRDGILTVTFKDKVHIKNSTRLDIYVSGPVIEKINLEGSGNIQTTNRLHSNNLVLVLNGSGKMVAEDACETAIVQLNGSGNITLTGKAKNQTASVSGSGNVNASGFTTENTTASLSGSGSIGLYATESLHASLSGSGSIRYSGNPASVKKEVSGSGMVESR
ncbi:head GIN domain-containing protein [Cytophaga hutchinsonii]|uniref:Putative auto-transporter adhesin head GIN domain-containing protein n=1 Tax=Cytophaga hutchinsonii (strain ATCC 33406 / DSM 1761 / CIP 103989 / NBRC 15051 / NCIMB 9469 / D465) TaxID=269798 RepID=A0A6N4SWX3_CYTH3|nr:head GIN domain-containing protein [Cytophaga hutchinsonii]ABG60801.1 conserved hypothetical protein [Cytophaga hutchinsonii ATCC 33406]SFX72243.1 Putative auto-transporter adhesin, head GIN domain [Cytophaga hutchinsonii ATCC 33406]